MERTCEVIGLCRDGYSVLLQIPGNAIPVPVTSGALRVIEVRDAPPKARRFRYPVLKMLVGDSFFVYDMKHPKNVVRSAADHGRILTYELVRRGGRWGYLFHRVA